MIVLLSGWASPVAGSVLLISSAGTHLGESAEICVSLQEGLDQIAGLQANLVWDDTCMAPTDARRLCRADPSTGKSAQSALQGRGQLKAIIISFSDLNPIPDGRVFCCSFTAIGAEGTRCPAVQLQQIVGSTSSGVRLNNIRSGNTGVFTVLPAHDGGGVPVVVPTTTSAGAGQRLSDDGCAIAAPGNDPSNAVATGACWALLLALAAWRRRSVATV